MCLLLHFWPRPTSGSSSARVSFLSACSSVPVFGLVWALCVPLLCRHWTEGYIQDHEAKVWLSCPDSHLSQDAQTEYSVFPLMCIPPFLLQFPLSCAFVSEWSACRTPSVAPFLYWRLSNSPSRAVHAHVCVPNHGGAAALPQSLLHDPHRQGQENDLTARIATQQEQYDTVSQIMGKVFPSNEQDKKINCIFRVKSIIK